MCSDLDRSTVWAETAVSSQFLRMALALVIGAADEALTWIGYAKIFGAVVADPCYVSMPTIDGIDLVHPADRPSLL